MTEASIPRRRANSLSDKELATLRKLWADRTLSVEAIAHEMNRSQDTLYRAAALLGLGRRIGRRGGAANRYSADELVFVQRMTNEGAAASAIAEAFFHEFCRRINRNAIISLWHRGKIQYPAGSSGRSQGANGWRKQKTAAVKQNGGVKPPQLPPQLVPKECPPPLNGVGVTLFELGHEQCRYPLWGVNETIGNFCGLDVRRNSQGEPNASFCSFHVARCLVRPSGKPFVPAPETEAQKHSSTSKKSKAGNPANPRRKRPWQRK